MKNRAQKNKKKFINVNKIKNNKMFDCLENYHKDEKNNKYLNYLYFLGVALFIIGALIYYYIYICSSYQAIDFLEGIKNDLYNTPIYDFSLNYVYNYDYRIYRLDSITFLKWKGTDLGCKCKDKPYTSGACTEPQKRLKCKHFSISARNFNYYRQKKLYAKREKLKYFLQDKSITKGKCPEGKKQCGILDSLGNKLCINEAKECPINDIKIDTFKNMNGYRRLELNEGKYIYFTNKKTNNTIISDLSVFQNDPCFYSQDNKWNKFFPLELGEVSSECKIRNGNRSKDERFKLLDSYNLSEFYREHLYFESDLVLNKDLYLNSKVNLYYRNYIGFDYNKLKGNIDNIYDDISKLIEIKEEERLFFSRIYDFFYNVILALSGYISIIVSVLSIAYATFQQKFQIAITKDIFIYIIFPELVILIKVLLEFFEMKKSDITVYDISDKIKDACDEYTKYGFDKLINGKIKFDLTYLRSKPLLVLIILLLIIISFVSILEFIFINFVNWLNKVNCSCDKKIQTSLIKDEEIREINELTEINNN